jgi:calcium-dependent protein kinase
MSSLCRALQQDKDSEVRKAAVGGIYSLGMAAAGKDVRAALVNSARGDENPGVRQVAAEAIRDLAKNALAKGAESSKSPESSWPLEDMQDLVSPQMPSKAMFDHRGLECLEDLYAIGEKIGQGSYGSVNRAFTRDTNIQRAVKTIDKTRLTSKTSDKLRVARLRLFQRELAIMKMLDHPHIVKLYHTFEDARHHFLVMESCEGGELFDYIMEKGRFTEAASAHVMGHVLKGTNYMHKTGVCHRDLKPENFLCLSKCAVESNTIKIIDFGLSNYLRKSVPLTTRAGTPYYVAPEVLRGIHDERCDLWSCGVVMYILLCGEPPFNGNSDAEIMRSTLKGHYLFENPVWKSVCQDAKDLIGKLLVPWDVRIPAEQALQHGWISQKTPKTSSRLSTISPGALIANLRMFKAAHELKKVAMQIIARQMHDTEGNFLRHIFEELDENNDGLLSPAEIKMGLEKAGMKDLPADFDELVSAADYDGSGAIDYTEFITAALSKDQYGRDDILWSCFRILDTDGNGKLSRDEVIKGLHDRGPRMSTSLSSVATNDYFNEADLNRDGEIDFEEFKAMMCGERVETPTRQISPPGTPARQLSA